MVIHRAESIHSKAFAIREARSELSIFFVGANMRERARYHARRWPLFPVRTASCCSIPPAPDARPLCQIGREPPCAVERCQSGHYEAVNARIFVKHQSVLVEAEARELAGLQLRC